jgi:hypothetical protein
MGTRIEVAMLPLGNLPFGWAGFAGIWPGFLRSDNVRVERLFGAGVVGAAKNDARSAGRSVKVFMMMMIIVILG